MLSLPVSASTYVWWCGSSKNAFRRNGHRKKGEQQQINGMHNNESVLAPAPSMHNTYEPDGIIDDDCNDD